MKIFRYNFRWKTYDFITPPPSKHQKVVEGGVIVNYSDVPFEWRISFLLIIPEKQNSALFEVLPKNMLFSNKKAHFFI